jgi:hypothetical protein
MKDHSLMILICFQRSDQGRWALLTISDDRNFNALVGLQDGRSQGSHHALRTIVGSLIIQSSQ